MHCHTGTAVRKVRSAFLAPAEPGKRSIGHVYMCIFVVPMGTFIPISQLEGSMTESAKTFRATAGKNVIPLQVDTRPDNRRYRRSQAEISSPIPKYIHLHFASGSQEVTPWVPIGSHNTSSSSKPSGSTRCRAAGRRYNDKSASKSSAESEKKSGAHPGAREPRRAQPGDLRPIRRCRRADPSDRRVPSTRSRSGRRPWLPNRDFGVDGRAGCCACCSPGSPPGAG